MRNMNKRRPETPPVGLGIVREGVGECPAKDAQVDPETPPPGYAISKNLEEDESNTR